MSEPSLCGFLKNNAISRATIHLTLKGWYR